MYIDIIFSSAYYFASTYIFVGSDVIKIVVGVTTALFISAIVIVLIFSIILYKR